MENDKRLNSDLARANRLGRRLELVIIVILTICYVSQGTKNSISTIGLVIIMASLWVPVIISYFLYKQNPASQMIKHVIGIGYGAFYLTVCLISDQQLVYTYAFPMLIIVAIYCDFKFSLLVGGACMIIAIIHSVVFTANADWTPQAVAAMEIEIASSILVGVYSAISNRFIIKMNERNLKQINDTTEKTEKLLTQVMEVSNAFAEEVKTVSTKMNELTVSSGETKDAMTDVSNGATETADAVQNQLVKTEEIQSQIGNVTNASKNIGESVDDAIRAIKEGKENIDRLMVQCKQSEEAGNKTVEEVEELKNYASEMENIVSLIQGITNQTSMLSLNASIEAARAGETGRGFAVVAGQISTLASQTKSATENISTMISNITHKMDEVTQAIEQLIESNKLQNESAHITEGSFEKISESAENINHNSGELTIAVDKLGVANREIVDSIQTVSAISEEVSAHATNTVQKSLETENIVNEVEVVVEEMTVNADKLKRLE